MNEQNNTGTQKVIENIYKSAFKKFLEQVALCIANTIIMIVVCVILAITIIGILAIPAISGGYTESMIRIARGEAVGIGDFLKIGFNHFGTLLGAGILSVLAIGVGLICFIIPGIYLMIRWFFIIQLIVDKNCEIFEAFEKSSKIVNGIFWEVLAVIILNAVISAIGGSIGVGIILTIPYVTLVCSFYYIYCSNEYKKSEEI